ncbi:MAG: SDR family NAD(P)-dependent oxidoreductase [Alphaproteobacteria bacterium]
MNTYDFKGRTAVVTGAARGIGYGVAEKLLQSGAKVSLWDLKQAELERASKALGNHGETHIAAVDVTKSDAIDAAIRGVESKWGKVDILVNNAGILGPRKPSHEHTNKEWQDCIDVLMTGTFYCMRAALPGMLGRKYGRIINIASTSGKEGSMMMPAYTAAKAGVIGMTKALGREYANTGVLINCITPANIDTEMTVHLGPAYREFALGRTPVGRYGRVEEVANLVAWIASEDCSYEAGGVFDISGGRSTY